MEQKPSLLQMEKLAFSDRQGPESGCLLSFTVSLLRFTHISCYTDSVTSSSMMCITIGAVALVIKILASLRSYEPPPLVHTLVP